MNMTSTMFRPASRRKLKARIAIDGPAGSGKSYTALRFAFALAGPSGRVAVIDTEHRSASKYHGEAPDGIPFRFDVCELEHYAPTTYSGVVREAGKAGYDVVVIDSLSHGWEGVGGALDQVDRAASRSKSGNSFTAWRDVTPQHREMVESILACPCHVIATMRSKMAYEMETDAKGKVKPVKVGLKPIQREGVEYEFDVVADMDLDHLLTISKSRCPYLDGAKVIKPGAQFLAPLVGWLAEGAEDMTHIPSPQAPAVFAENAMNVRFPSPDGAGRIVETGRAGVQLTGNAPPDVLPGGNQYSESINAPCGEQIANEIKTIGQQLGMPAAKLAEIVRRYGARRIAEIPHNEAVTILGKLKTMAIEAELANPPF